MQFEIIKKYFHKVIKQYITLYNFIKYRDIVLFY